MSPQVSGGFVKVHKSSLGFRGHLITNLPNVVVLLLIIICCLSAIWCQLVLILEKYFCIIGTSLQVGQVSLFQKHCILTSCL